jgi:muramoyltetrapeptide carboxypeptidase
MIKIPEYLKQGDTIGVICPSGYMPYKNMETCLQVLEQWGFKVKKGKTLGTQFNYFSGTDEKRLADLQQMLDNVEVKAILCARGGYGLSRIIDRVDFTTFIKQPKWIIGYSDITILHSHILSNYNIASMHSPMAAAFNDGGSETKYIKSLLTAITGNPAEYQCEGYKLNKQGTTIGELVGGNLCLLAHLIGSSSSVDTNGKILFIEDIGEYIYNIDRLMLQLQRAGKLQDLAGLVVGSFTDMKDTIIPFGASVYDVIYDKVKDYNYPVCFNFPVGHTQENVALKHGIVHKLEVAENKVSLREKH